MSDTGQRKENMIIGIAGYKGSGKTTAAKCLMHRGFTRIRFAQGLKAMLQCLGLDERHTDGELKEVPCDLLAGKTPRWAMQSLGTEWGRNLIDKDLWINDWKRRVANCQTPIVVDDLRFPNEQEAVVKMGGTILFIQRNGLEAGDGVHASEDLGHIVPDYIIPNNGTIQGMKAELIALIDAINDHQ